MAEEAWTGHEVCQKMIEAYRTIQRRPVVVVGPRAETYTVLGPDQEHVDLGPVTWIERYLNKPSGKQFINQHVRWVVEGRSIRLVVRERGQSWTSYQRRRRRLCGKIAERLTAHQVARPKGLDIGTNAPGA